MLEMGGGEEKKPRLYLNLCHLQNNIFPRCSKNKKHLDCPFKSVAEEPDLKLFNLVL